MSAIAKVKQAVGKILQPQKADDQPVGEKIVAARARRLELVPAASRRLIAACWAKKAPPRQAVKAFCQECVGYERRAVTECTAYACPLWRFRPYQNAEKDRREESDAAKGKPT
jgi:hypothetical protein